MSKNSPAPNRPATQPPAPASARTNPAEAANKTRLQPPTANGVPSAEAVRARAHALWEQAGRPPGDGVEYWLRAEQELGSPR